MVGRAVGRAGTVGLRVTSTQREAAVGREGRCKHSDVLTNGGKPCPQAFHGFSRHALLI